jgi:hypothetical protein
MLGEHAFGAAWDRAAPHTLYRAAIRLFQGGHPRYQAFDTVYHDLEHTLRVTLCWMRMFCGCRRQQVDPQLDIDWCITGLAAALFHDSGYLKVRGDKDGTGAKHTAIHERRSAIIAAEILGELDWNAARVQSVQRAISATGANQTLEKIAFHSATERRIGLMLCSADFLAQMSDPAYPEKLSRLFAEFTEAKAANPKPPEGMVFNNVGEMLAQTPTFWRTFVLPRLEGACAGLYHYLREPWPDGPNPYVEQAEANVARIDAGLRARV